MALRALPAGKLPCRLCPRLATPRSMPIAPCRWVTRAAAEGLDGCGFVTGPSGIATAAAAFGASLVLACALPATAASIEDIKQAVAKDFEEGQYYVTGRLTRGLYEPNCRFVDPTTDVEGVDKYTAAVAALFDPAVSHADLISIQAVDPHTLQLRWRLEGRLRLGGLSLPIKPYTGTTRYIVDDRGLISRWGAPIVQSLSAPRHEETWDISATDAFVSTFLPSFGAPAAPPVQRVAGP